MRSLLRLAKISIRVSSSVPSPLTACFNSKQSNSTGSSISRSSNLQKLPDVSDLRSDTRSWEISLRFDRFTSASTHSVVFVLKRRFDFQSLFCISIAENIDQRLFVRSETFHRFAQRIGVAIRIEIRCGDHRSLLLNDDLGEKFEPFRPLTITSSL